MNKCVKVRPTPIVVLRAPAGSRRPNPVEGGELPEKGDAVVELTPAGRAANVATALAGPLLGVLGAWSGYRSATATTRTPRERRAMQRFFAAILGASVLMMLFGGILGPRLASGLEPGRAIMLGLAFVLPYAALLVAVAWLGKRAVARVREEEKRRHPEAYAGPREGAFGPLLEYRSPVRLLGLPLVHVRLSTPPGEPVLPAVGWVAIGDRAIGVLFAFGGLAVGAISFGGLALGLLTLGGIAAGLFAMGGIVVGWTAMGGVAVGVVAAGGNAFGWTAADGGVIAVARDFARGTHAAARHVNDDAARLFFARHPWTNTDEPSGRLLLNLAYLPILLVVLPRWLLAGRRQSR